MEAASKLISNILSALNRYLWGVIYLDLRQAFDSFSHTILLSKLQYTGVNDFELKWFEDYLSKGPKEFL